MNGCLQDLSLLIPSAAHAIQASAAYFLWPPTCPLEETWGTSFRVSNFLPLRLRDNRKHKDICAHKRRGPARDRERETSAARRALSEIRHHIYVKTNSPFNQMLVPLTHDRDDYVKQDEFGTAFFQQDYFLTSSLFQKSLTPKIAKSHPACRFFLPTQPDGKL